MSKNIISNFENGIVKEKNIILNFNSSGKSLYINADMIKIESIITNLISNSAKYCNEGGIIEFNIENDKSKLRISISDNGIGIPEKDLPYVSQRFFQSSLTAGKKQGTGIGLYLVKSYAELHNGIFLISSEEGKGTVVNVLLPIEESEQIDLKDNTQISENNDLPLVLIVEDNDEVAEFIKDTFKGSFNSVIARNGKEGLNMTEEYNPNLIITDLMMPEIDGMGIYLSDCLFGAKRG